MPTNSEEIVEQMSSRSAPTSNPCSPSPGPVLREAPTVYELEGGLFERLLALGPLPDDPRLRLCGKTARVRRRPDLQGRCCPITARNPDRSSPCSVRSGCSGATTGRGNGSGWFPLDAALNLPPSRISDRVREWRELLGTDLAYHPAGASCAECWGSRLLAGDQRPRSPPTPTRSKPSMRRRLPRAADPGRPSWSCRPMARGCRCVTPTEPKARLGKGGEDREEEGSDRDGGLHAIALRPRTPEAVSTACSVTERSRSARNTPGPVGTSGCGRRWTGRRPRWRSPRDRPNAGRDQDRSRIALTDGSEALQERVREAFPGYTLVLDFIHADEYLWKVANALLGETAPERTGG